MAKPRKTFINLPVRDLQKSVAFFKSLGFEFNAKFTDANATSMIVSEESYVMLLVRPFFQTFTKREICESTHTEAIVALSAESKEEVNALVEKAIAAGGTHALPPADNGFMYGWSFYDLDGHHWEVFWMDPAVATA